MSEYTNDWCDGHLPAWRELLSEYTGKPDVRMLEVGSYEGRSACWFAENILTGKDAKILCVDPWRAYSEKPGDEMAEVEARFDANTAAYPQIVKFRGTLPEAFALMSSRGERRIDVVYVDGSHAAGDVLVDAVFGWECLRVGGLLMFDDWTWNAPDGGDDSPKLAISAFAACMEVGGRMKAEAASTSNLVALRRLR